MKFLLMLHRYGRKFKMIINTKKPITSVKIIKNIPINNRYKLMNIHNNINNIIHRLK